MTLLKLRNSEPSFNSFIDEFFDKNSFLSNYLSDIKTNIKELDDKYVLELSLAGFKKEDIKIDIDNDILTILSDVKTENEEETDNYKRYEFRKSSFQKSYSIPSDVDINKITASQENGVLKIELVKQEDKIKQIKTIEIK
jgi:HSP20 family protein